MTKFIPGCRTGFSSDRGFHRVGPRVGERKYIQGGIGCRPGPRIGNIHSKRKFLGGIHIKIGPDLGMFTRHGVNRNGNFRFLKISRSGGPAREHVTTVRTGLHLHLIMDHIGTCSGDGSAMIRLGKYIKVEGNSFKMSRDGDTLRIINTDGHGQVGGSAVGIIDDSFNSGTPVGKGIPVVGPGLDTHSFIFGI